MAKKTTRTAGKTAGQATAGAAQDKPKPKAKAAAAKGKDAKAVSAKSPIPKSAAPKSAAPKSAVPKSATLKKAAAKTRSVIAGPKASASAKPKSAGKAARSGLASAKQLARQTSDAISALASDILADRIVPTLDQIKSLAASALGQDQTKGKSKKAKTARVKK